MESSSGPALTIHVCEYCAKEFSTGVKLNKHRKIHLPKRDYNCGLCKYTTKVNANMKSHLRTHTKEKPFKCPQPLCDKAFAQISNLRTHQRKLHEQTGETLLKIRKTPAVQKNTNDEGNSRSESLHVCEHCKKTYSTKAKLNQHKRLHLPKTEFKCSHCEYSTKNKTYFTIHLQTHTKCPPPNCDSTFSQSSNLATHQLRHNKKDDPVTKLKCEHCPFKTVSQYRLKIHMFLHSTNTRSFKCSQPNCSFSCKDQQNLNDHMKQHRNKKPFSCSFPSCAFKTKYKHYLKHHEKRHRNPEENTEKIKTTNCDYSRAQNANLKKHRIVHHKRETLVNIKCELCTYKTPIKARLKKHMKVHHSGVKRFFCDKCLYKTKQKNNLWVHIHRVHHTLKRFQCSQTDCSYSSVNYAMLARHRKRHEDEKPFVCSFPGCSYRATYRKCLKKHHLTHLEGTESFKYCPSKDSGSLKGQGKRGQGKSHSSQRSSGSENTTSNETRETPITHVQWSVDWGTIVHQRESQVVDGVKVTRIKASKRGYNAHVS